MKKLICVTLLVFMMLGCLTACNFNFNTNLGGSLGNAASDEKVDEMMAALTENDISAAKSLLHPERSADADKSLEQIADFLNGRSVASKLRMNVNITTSTGTAGKTVQEQTAYRVSLNDGTVVYLNAVYLTTDAGEGFVSFQLVLGLV